MSGENAAMTDAHHLLLKLVKILLLSAQQVGVTLGVCT